MCAGGMELKVWEEASGGQQVYVIYVDHNPEMSFISL